MNTGPNSTDDPLVSVVIPSYNHAADVEAAIRSVLDQTYFNIELVVVDDGSTDDSWAVVERVRAKTGNAFKAIRKVNGGVSSALNAGVELTSGSLVAVLASDDRFLPEKVARQVDLFRRSPASLGLVHTNAVEEYPGGMQVPLTGRFVPAVGRCLKDLVARRVTAIAPTVMFRREVYDAIGGFDTRLVGEDLDFYAGVAANGYELAYDPTPLLVKSHKPGGGLGAAVERFFKDPFITLEKYAQHFTEAERCALEDSFYLGMMRASAGVGKARLAFGFARTLYARKGPRIYGLLALLLARNTVLTALPLQLRYRLRAARSGDLRRLISSNA